MSPTRRVVVFAVIAVAITVAIGGGVRLASTPWSAESQVADNVRRASDPGAPPALAGRPGPAPAAANPGATDELPAMTDEKAKRPETRFVAGVVVDEDSLPIASAVVEGLGVATHGAVRTSAEGRFLLPMNTEEQSVRLRVRAVGFAGWKSDGIAVDGTSARIVLERGRRVVGMVVDPEGRPVAGASVSTRFGLRSRPAAGLRTVTGESVDESVLQPPWEVRTDATGAFIIDGFGSEEEVLNANAEGWSPADPTSVSPPSNGVVIRLKVSLVFEGTVQDQEGRPVSGARLVSSEPREGWINCSTDSDGRFRVDCLPAISHSINI